MFSNPWFVGIGGGILSGLIVAFISRFIFSRRDSREYAQKVYQANNEMLYAVRPGISEGVIPTNTVLERLIDATARKYSIEKSDMHDLDQISSDLTKEVMDSSFISASSKQEFCQKLTAIQNDDDLLETINVLTKNSDSVRYRQQLVLSLSLMAGSLTMLVAIFSITDTGNLGAESPTFIFVPSLVAIFVAVISVLLGWFRRVGRNGAEKTRYSGVVKDKE